MSPEATRAQTPDELARRLAGAKHAIASKVCRFHDKDASPGWGQYLNDHRNTKVHTGIFGTTAALEILAETDRAEYAADIESALPTLPLLVDGDAGEGTIAREIRDKYIGKDDLAVTHKVAALLDAALSLERSGHTAVRASDSVRSAVESLLSLRPSQTGWPDCSMPNLGSSKHATAAALLSLSRVTDEQSRDGIATALRETVKVYDHSDFPNLGISTTAMLLMALSNFEENGHFRDELVLWSEIKSAAEASVLAWIITAPSSGVRRTLEATEYASPDKAEADNAPANGRWSFLLYLPHVVAAQAVLMSPTLREDRRARVFVLGVLSILTDSLIVTGQFVPGGRSLISTVEQLWIFRLLVVFEKSHKTLYSRRWLRTWDEFALRGFGAKTMAVIPAVVAVVLFVAVALLRPPYSTILAIPLSILVATLVRKLMDFRGRRL